jgi:transposase-like protein
LMAKWGEKYPQAVNAWDRNFNELTTFFKFPYELKKFIYTTNPIENLNRSIRYVSKRRGVFQNEKSLDNFVYLGIRRHMKNWRRKIVNDDIIAKQLDELFPEFKDCKCKYEVAELGIPE